MRCSTGAHDRLAGTDHWVTVIVIAAFNFSRGSAFPTVALKILTRKRPQLDYQEQSKDVRIP